MYEVEVDMGICTKCWDIPEYGMRHADIVDMASNPSSIIVVTLVNGECIGHSSLNSETFNAVIHI
mgnify:CR=1 FL=1